MCVVERWREDGEEMRRGESEGREGVVWELVVGFCDCERWEEGVVVGDDLVEEFWGKGEQGKWYSW